MRMENPPVIEVQQLVLPTALHARDTRPDEGPKLLWIETSTQRGMQYAHAHDRAATCACAQHVESGFYFW
jgi:hypothetical protein